MTLTTHVRVLDPVPVAELFAECRRLLGAGPEIEIRHSDPRKDGHAGYYSDRMYHDFGVGLAAWCCIEYAVERPLPTDERVQESRECGEPVVPHFACVTFDMGYGYEAPNGAHCNDLHAQLVAEIGVWLAERGRRCEWQHEYDGSWHDLDKVELLGNVTKGALR